MHQLTKEVDKRQQIAELQNDWDTNPRWIGINRDYTAQDVVNLRGSLHREYTIAKLGAARLLHLLRTEPYLACLGAYTGGQAVQQAKAGIKSIYLSGWQVAADANTNAQMYPDQSLYSVDSVPGIVERINNAFTRADEIQWANDNTATINYFLPIVADCEAGFGGNLNAFELAKACIKAGAAGIHFEDQLASAKKCGHLGGKVLIPTREAIYKLRAARLASDVMGTGTLIVGRTDADAAALITSDIDPTDQPFLTGERTVEGFYLTTPGLPQAISRGLAYAPYCDIIWCETAKPDLNYARLFAEAIHAKFPGKFLGYNCSPSFNWKLNLSDDAIAAFQPALAEMGYKYQFITLAGVHSNWYHTFDLAYDYVRRGMPAYIEKIQEPEFLARKRGYTFVSHQQEVGTGYFDAVSTALEAHSTITGLKGSTEEEQFHSHPVGGP
jgi:isocitrate lyase